MLFEECFRVLDVSPHASKQEIRSAYKTLVRVWHPDRLGSDPKLRSTAQKKLATINEAYRTLEEAGFPSARQTDDPPDAPPAAQATAPPPDAARRASGENDQRSTGDGFWIQGADLAGLVVGIWMLATDGATAVFFPPRTFNAAHAWPAFVACCGASVTVHALSIRLPPYSLKGWPLRIILFGAFLGIAFEACGI